jgi:hypothetical protein
MMAIFIASTFLFSSCASIVSKSSYTISINSVPSEAKIVIKDKKTSKFSLDKLLQL